MPKVATPFIGGLVAGAFLISVLGLANEWVVTTDSKNTQVSDAWINAQASICVSLAEAHLKTTKSIVSLDGYQAAAREARDDLARQFAVALPGEKAVNSIVVTTCAQMLNKPNA